MVSSQCSSFQIERFPFADDTLTPFFHRGEKIDDGGDIANQGEVMVIVTAIWVFLFYGYVVNVLGVGDGDSDGDVSFAISWLCC